MELMEDHHPGRLPIKTVRIPKLVHDLIHQGERDAVREIFEKDGLKGNPGRWTAKRIPEPVEEFDSTPLNLSLSKSSYLRGIVSSEEAMRRSIKKFIQEMNDRARDKEEMNRRVEENGRSLLFTGTLGPQRLSFLVSTSNLLPILAPPSQSQPNLGTNLKPFFVLGGKEDIEALMRRKFWEENNFYEKTAPNGYERDPVHFVSGVGWKKSFSREVESPIPRGSACGDFITTFAKKRETISGLPTIKFKQPKWY